jgi:hypothetical protein
LTGVPFSPTGKLWAPRVTAWYKRTPRPSILMSQPQTLVEQVAPKEMRLTAGCHLLPAERVFIANFRFGGSLME